MWHTHFLRCSTTVLFFWLLLCRTCQQWVWVTEGSQKKAQGPQWRLCFLTSHCGGQRVHCNWQRWGRLLRKYSFTSSQSTGGKNFRELNWRDGCAPHKYQSNACVFSHVDVDDLRLCHAHKIIVSVWFLKTQICYNQCQSLIISNCQDNPSVAALDAD